MPYYIHANDKIEGPWEPDELLVQPGVDGKTMVCTSERFSDWTELAAIPELKLLLHLRGENVLLAEKKSEAEKQVRGLEEEYENWARQLHGKIAEQNALLEDRLLKLDDAAKAVQAKTRESELFKTRLRELKTQYLEVKQYSEIQEQDFLKLRKHLHDKLVESEEELRKAKKDLEETRKEHADREHALREQERDCKRNAWEMSHMEEQWLEVHQQNKLLIEAKNRLEDDLRKAEADIAELEKRVQAGEREVREAPARAMKAEIEAASLRETLAGRENDIEKLKVELAHTIELTHINRDNRRKDLDKITLLEHEIKDLTLKLRTDGEEIVRLRASAVERENKSQMVVQEMNRFIDELKTELHKSQTAFIGSQEEIAQEQSEHKKLDSKWHVRAEELSAKSRAREEELREEIRRIEQHLFKYRDDNESLEQRSRETGRKLKNLQDKETELQRERERLDKIIARKDERIKMLEAYIKEPEREEAGIARETAAVQEGRPPTAYGGGISSPYGSVSRAPHESAQTEKVQTHVLKSIEGRVQHIEGLNQLLRDNMHQMISAQDADERRVREEERSLGRRFAQYLLWVLWGLLVLGLAWILRDYIQTAKDSPPLDTSALEQNAAPVKKPEPRPAPGELEAAAPIEAETAPVEDEILPGVPTPKARKPAVKEKPRVEEPLAVKPEAVEPETADADLEEFLPVELKAGEPQPIEPETADADLEEFLPVELKAGEPQAVEPEPQEEAVTEPDPLIEPKNPEKIDPMPGFSSPGNKPS